MTFLRIVIPLCLIAAAIPHHNFIAKAACLCHEPDKMVGGDFEQGLANLKSVVETARKT